MDICNELGLLVIEEFFEKVGMRRKPAYEPSTLRPYLHPGRQAVVSYEGREVAFLGEVHPTVAGTYGIGERAYLAVVDILSVLEYANFDYKYEGLAKYPAVTRDISMVVPKDVRAGQIENVLEQRGGKVLEDYSLFDLYEGKQIKPGYKSMAYSVTLRAKERTLEEKDVTAVMKKILHGLEGLGIELRS